MVSSQSWKRPIFTRLYSSFFSAWCTDFKSVIFQKIHWAPSEVVEVKRSFSRSLRPNFGFHLVFTSFHLEFSSFWVLMPFDLGNLGDLIRGSGNFFKNYIFVFWNQCIPRKKDEACLRFLLKIFTKSVDRRGVISYELSACLLIASQWGQSPYEFVLQSVIV